MSTSEHTSVLTADSTHLGLRPVTPLASFLTVLVALIVGAALTSGRIVTMVERKPLGDDRDRMLSAATRFDNATGAVGLDTPTMLANDVLGRADGPSEQFALEPPTDSAPTALTTTTAPATTAPTTTSASVTAAPTAPTTTTTAPTTTTEAKRVISTDKPLRIWAGGDSLGEYVGQELKAIAEPTGLAVVRLDYHISTGLTRPDYFDWPARLDDGLAAENGGELVVFMVGGNDNQPMISDSGRLETTSPPWLDEYSLRSGLILDLADGYDSNVIWIALPPMRDEERERISIALNSSVEAAVATRSNASFYDPAPLLEGDEGAYSQYVTGPDGELRQARAPDGVHITRQASRWIAQALWEQILIDWPTIEG